MCSINLPILVIIFAIFCTSSECLLKISHYNLTQEIVDKFTKSSKIAFATEYFTPDFCNFLAPMSKFSVGEKNPSISGILFKFSNFKVIKSFGNS